MGVYAWFGGWGLEGADTWKGEKVLGGLIEGRKGV